MSSLFACCKANDVNGLSHYLDGVVPDFRERDDNGLTALHICATYGSVEALIKLLNAGALECIDLPDYENGWTPIHRSIYFGHLKITLLLLRSGAKIGHEYFKNDWKFDIYPRRERRRAIRDINSWKQSIDHDGLDPLDLLSLSLSKYLDLSKKKMEYTSILTFGKADYTLGVPLPNSTCDVYKPKRIDELDGHGIVYVAADKYHSLALTKDGELYVWGHNKSGRLGLGNDIHAAQPIPRKIDFNHKISVIATAENHTLAVTNSGKIFSWGSDRYSQLGHGGTTGHCSFPREIEVFKRTKIIGIAAGEFHSLCYTNSGDLYAWGSNKNGQLGFKPCDIGTIPAGGSGVLVPKRLYLGCLSSKFISSVCPIIQVSASNQSSLFLLMSADIITNDNNNNESGIRKKKCNEVYQCGNGSQTATRVNFTGISKQSFSVEKECTTKMLNSIHDINVTQVSAGKYHNVALSTAGHIYTWGFGSDQLGHGVGQARIATPQLVESLLPENGGGRIVYIQSSSHRTCALSDVGDLYCWGVSNDQGILETSNSRFQPVPKRVMGIKRAVQVAIGENHTLVLTAASLPPLPHFDKICDTEVKGITDDIDNEPDDYIECEKCVKLNTEVAEDCISWVSMPTLTELCERTLAKCITYKTMIQILSVAESLECKSLLTFCFNFVQRNLDAIMVQSRQCDIETLLEKLDCSSNCSLQLKNSFINRTIRSDSFDHLFSEFSLQRGTSIGSDSGNEYSKSKSGSVGSDDGFNTPRLARKISFNPASSFDESSQHSVAKSINSVPAPRSVLSLDTCESVSKRIRAIKKKLMCISDLQSKSDSVAITPEQIEKLSKKSSLEHDLKNLTLLYKTLEGKENIIKNAENMRRASGIATISPPKSLAEWEKIVKSTPNDKSTLAQKCASSNDAVAEKVPMLSQHVETPCNSPNVSSNVWKSNHNQSVNTVSLDSIINEQSQQKATVVNCSPSTATKAWNYNNVSSNNKKVSLNTIISEQMQAQKALTSNIASQNGHNMTKSSTRSQGLTLDQFIVSPTRKDAPNACPWNTANLMPDKINNNSNSNGKVDKRKSFLEIQNEEEEARLNSNLMRFNNESPWFVDRRKRADSLEEVMKLQEIEKQFEEKNQISQCNDAAKSGAMASRSSRKKQQQQIH